MAAAFAISFHYAIIAAITPIAISDTIFAATEYIAAFHYFRHDAISFYSPFSHFQFPPPPLVFGCRCRRLR